MYRWNALFTLRVNGEAHATPRHAALCPLRLHRSNSEYRSLAVE